MDRKRARDEQPEKLPVAKRRKAHSPAPPPLPLHDHSHNQEIDNSNWNRSLAAAEPSRRFGGTKSQTVGESSGTLAVRGGTSREKSIRHSVDPKVPYLTLSFNGVIVVVT